MTIEQPTDKIINQENDNATKRTENINIWQWKYLFLEEMGLLRSYVSVVTFGHLYTSSLIFFFFFFGSGMSFRFFFGSGMSFRNYLIFS